jgi:hypothetical protein
VGGRKLRDNRMRGRVDGLHVEGKFSELVRQEASAQVNKTVH